MGGSEGRGRGRGHADICWKGGMTNADICLQGGGIVQFNAWDNLWQFPYFKHCVVTANCSNTLSASSSTYCYEPTPCWKETFNEFLLNLANFSNGAGNFQMAQNIFQVAQNLRHLRPYIWLWHRGIRSGMSLNKMALIWQNFQSVKLQ